MKRIISYDVKEGNKYDDLYKALDELNGKQLTKSTYMIDTSLSQQEIIQKIHSTIKADDNVVYISVDGNDKTLFALKI